MNFKWMDKRVAALVPEGLDSMTLSKKEAEMKMWLPGIVVTNRDSHKFDLVSTSVMINRKGEVFRVDRATVVVKNKYKLNHYPYDEQDLVVKVASSKYMLDEVILKPSTEKGSMGVADNLMKGYSYKFIDVGASAIKDIDGALMKKSRGLLTISVKRDGKQYFQTHLIPSFLLACISFGIFYFPFIAPFITPRVKLSILALLAFTNLTIMSNNALPDSAPFNWNDLLNQTVLTLMFSNVFMNILSEVCFHQLKLDDLAKCINHENKVVAPFVFMLSVGTVLSTAGPGGYMSLGHAGIVVKVQILVIVGGFLAFNMHRISTLLKEAEAKAKAKAKEASA